jgi:hypothetical protein
VKSVISGDVVWIVEYDLLIPFRSVCSLTASIAERGKGLVGRLWRGIIHIERPRGSAALRFQSGSVIALPTDIDCDMDGGGEDNKEKGDDGEAKSLCGIELDL